ncbi:MAG: alpha-2-macroglobulin [Spirochaetaceae bacterium]|jgi:uncharacterized protein YfaS (alpha-2-macroglobulin family)|nr:alpha-2-macroglobulin [Spirochaetaceae bacterium]
MQKLFLPLQASIVVMVAVLFPSCEKTAAQNVPTEPRAAITATEEAFSEDGEWANAEAVKAAFELDYRAQFPEPEQEEERLDLRTGPASGGGNQVVGGERRAISEYATKYFDAASVATERSRIEAILAAQEAGTLSNAGTVVPAQTAGDFAVVDWGPQGLYQAANQHPSLYVIFNQPVTPLAALGTPSASSPVVTISPPTKGVFRWYGTAFLAFEGDEPLQSQQNYTITVSPSAKSIYGNPITGERVFTFQTETLQMLRIVPGEQFKKDNPRFYFTDRDVPPEAARFVTIEFNYPVLAADMEEHIAVTVSGEARPFRLTQTDERKVLCEITSGVGAEPAVPFEKTVSVVLKAGAKSNGTIGSAATRGTERETVKTFSTPGAFKIDSFKRRVSYGRYRNLVDIEFSYPLDENSVTPASIRTDPPMPITRDTIEVWGKTLRVCNLPVTYGDTFTLSVAGQVKDRYGRTLGAARTETIKVPDEPPPEGRVAFLNRYDNVVMLEAQFPPRYLFEYTNIESGNYTLSAVGNPFVGAAGEPKTFPLETGKVNTKYFADIDLKPFLNAAGKGFVRFNADIQLLPKLEEPRRSGLWYDTTTDDTVIQVTDIGLTVRYGFNKAAVLATSLETGKPLEGVNVRLIAPELARTVAAIDEAAAIASGVTDSTGLAVINMDAGVFRTSVRSTRWSSQPYVYAEKDGDRAVFAPGSHNTWRYSVYAGNVVEAERVEPVTFLFTDRGLYKPGETLTFRGIDRSKILGNYAMYTGAYTLTLEEDRYGGQTVATIEDTTSESGGFWGRITLPDTVEPGAYRLVYRRPGSKTIAANVPVTIAYFERLKFQANVAQAASTLVSGDTVNTTLTATYLSGGSLSGAQYTALWYRDISFFHPNTAATKGYTFGPRRSGDGRRSLGETRGVLSGDGTAKLSQNTGDESVKGAPYRYWVEAAVTDLSNQMASASASFTVHPARFYIGVRRSVHQSAGGGFIRAGQEAAFELITVNTGGESAHETLFLQTGANAKTAQVTLHREEWRRVQQSGVNGYVYNEYVREEVPDGAQTIGLTGDGAAFKLKPSKAGYYVLRVSADDRDGKTALTEMTFYVTGSGAGYWNSTSADEIRLVPDQNEYNPGDKAVIMLQSELPAGHYLITVEREGIFTEEVRYIEGSGAVIEIPIARNFVPVVYVAVSSYSVRQGPPTHEYGSPDLDKPKGYFGVAKLFVNPRVRSFSVTMDSGKKSFRPGETVTMTLTATQNGRPIQNAEFTLMAVDRGVLDLINYHVPDPIAYFYNEGRFPLSVAGGDSRALLMDPVTYSVKNLQGGDSAENDSKIEERADFNPTAVFEPALITDEKGQVVCTFKLPDTLTTYRVTAVGVYGDTFALKESEIAAQNLLNVREVLPRRLRERDTAEAGVLLTNLDNKPHTVTVNLRTAPPRNTDTETTGRLKPSGLALVDGASERSVTIGAGANAVLYFDVAAVKAGYITLEFTTKSDILNERLVNELQIERPFVMETVTTTGSIGADEQSATEAVAIPSFADGGVGSLSVTLDATRIASLESAIGYLFHYPYGCLEQRSAAILPLVLFGDYLDALSLKDEVADPRKVVENELKEWAKIQLSNGGFPYWPSETTASGYVSLRIAHIVALAKTKGIAVPAALNTAKLLNYLESHYREVTRWTSGHDDYAYQGYYAAWTLYLMALYGRAVDPGRLAALVSRNAVDVSTLAYAGLAYLHLGKKAEAAAAAQKLRGLLHPTARGVDIVNPGAFSSYSSFSGYFNQPVEQLALTLEFFVQQYPGDDMNTRLLYSLLQNKKANGGYWDNTATTVRVLSAVDALIRAENLERLNVNAAVTLAATELLRGSFHGLGAKPVTSATAFDQPPLNTLTKDRMEPLVFTRNGTGAVYYTVELRYAIPQELQTYRDEGLGVFMSITDAETGEEVRGTTLQTGKTYRARVKLSSTHNRAYVALRVPVPSGAEILDAAFVTTPRDETAAAAQSDDTPWHRRSSISHEAIYDNEIQYFYDTLRAGEAEAAFLFRAARRGIYPTPPLAAECMYEPEIFGRTGGVLWVIE